MERHEIDPFVIDSDQHDDDVENEVVVTTEKGDLIGTFIGWFDPPREDYIEFQEHIPHGLYPIHNKDIIAVRWLFR